jgi:CRP-like cAMP-binding protein
MEGPVLLRRFGPGETIMNRDEPAQAMFVVQMGSVEVTGPGGVTSRLGPGQMFGEVSLILGAPHRQTAVAVMETALVCVGLKDLQWLCLESPDFSLRLIRHLAEQANGKPLRTSVDPRGRRARLAQVILDLALDEGTPALVEGRLRDLAEASDIPILDREVIRGIAGPSPEAH